LYFRLKLLDMGFKKAVALAPNPLFRDGYWLLLRDQLQETPCPAGGSFLTEYDICLKYTEESARKLGKTYKAPLKLKPELNEETERWDLRVDLQKGGRSGAHHINYHRLVGLTLKMAKHGSDGRKLRTPVVVGPQQWSSYEVNHKDFNNFDCRLLNLQPKEVGRHRGEGRDAWSRNCLSHAEKVQLVKVKIAQLRNKAKLLKKPASAPRRSPGRLVRRTRLK
jgi:hypothetical protein